jgi:hypothetical protein
VVRCWPKRRYAAYTCKLMLQSLNIVFILTDRNIHIHITSFLFSTPVRSSNLTQTPSTHKTNASFENLITFSKVSFANQLRFQSADDKDRVVAPISWITDSRRFKWEFSFHLPGSRVPISPRINSSLDMKTERFPGTSWISNTATQSKITESAKPQLPFFP